MRSCRLCFSRSTEVVLDLGHHPLADRFLTPAMLDASETFYPLRVYQCMACGYAGLTHVVHDQERYRAADYSYTAGNSPVSRAHFAELAGAIAQRASLSASSLAVDIGGNDGTLLRAVQERGGCRLLNVEASPNMAELSRHNGVPIARVGAFDMDAVDDIKDRGGADVIACTNVLNHASEPLWFLECASRALRPHGILVIEVPDLGEMFRRNAWDTVYLEHVSYFEIGALARALGQAGLYVTGYEVTPYMGGSMRVWAAKQPAAWSASTMRAEDALAGWKALGARASVDREFVLTELAWCRYERNETIIAIGAATKGNTLLNYCKLDTRLITCVADASPLKIGKFTPGNHIPIVSDDDIPADASHALVLPWNIGAYLRDKLAARGLHFIERGNPT